MKHELTWSDRGSPIWQYLKVPCKDGASQRFRSPYGAIGDLLWVREPLRRTVARGYVAYVADNDIALGPNADPIRWPWKPKALASRYCPRWASRYTLEITSTRVQHLQEIAEADILAEGITREVASQRTGMPLSQIPSLYDAWRVIWDSINPTEGDRWDDDPWVWCVGFKRLA